MTSSISDTLSEAARASIAHTPFQHLFPLDPHIVALNHGSYGSSPYTILEQYAAHKMNLERNPNRFLGYELRNLLYNATEKLAAFIHAPTEQVAYIPNTTFGVNSVIKSFSWSSSDTILTTSQAYNACKNVISEASQRYGCAIEVVDIPFPIGEDTDIVGRILEKMNENVRLIMLDHVVSPTSLILPVGEIISAARAQGIATLIDGAHAPGMLPLSMEALRPDFYVGNCHKWLCAPRGTAFLYVDRQYLDSIHPAVTSHGFNDPDPSRSRFEKEFSWLGTNDYIAYLCVPDTIALLGTLLPRGWEDIYERNHQLAIAAYELVKESLQLTPAYPNHACFGSMATLPISDGDSIDLVAKAFNEAQLDVLVYQWPGAPRRNIRLSCHLYNDIRQYEYMVSVMKRLL
jgi:isopenicillin-N epimerase